MRSLTYLLVSCEGVAMNLHAGRAFGRVLGIYLVESKYFAGGGIELIMVDLDGGQGGVEGKLDV